MATSLSAFSDATPFVLRLAYEKADFMQVQRHWSKNFLRKFSANEPVHALIGRVLRQIREDDYTIREYYTFPLKEVTTTTGEDQIAEIRLALIQLSDVKFHFEQFNRNRIFICRLVNTSHERPPGHDRTSVTVLINPQLHQYLLNVAALDV